MTTTSPDPAGSRRSALAARVARFLPFLQWTARVHRRTLRADLSAGLVGGIVVLPQGVAFATLAGLPPQYGLYAAMVPTVVAALFGSSWQMVSGPAATTSVVLFSSLHLLAVPGSEEYLRYAITLTFMVGVIQLAMGIARLGVLAEFISHSVVVGFTAGTAIIIATNQLRDFLGIGLIRGLHFYDILLACYRRIPDYHWPTLIVGVTTILSAVMAKRYLPKLPQMLAAILGGSMVYLLLLLFWDAADSVSTVGALPASLPPLSRPDFAHGPVRELASTALAVSLFSLAQSVSIARTLATRSGQLFNGNQEFIGQGLSNVFGSFFSAFVGTGSFTRSALNYQAGARTPLAAVFSAGVLALVVLVVAPLTAYLPKAALAGVLMVVAWGLVDVGQIRRILFASRSDATVMGVTLAATLLLDLDFAILVGVLLSLAIYLNRTARPRVLLRAPDPGLERRRFNTAAALPECPQLRIVRIDGSLFFGAVNYVAQRLRFLEVRRPEQRHLWILAQSINFADVAGAELLARLAEERRRQGGALYLSHVKPGVHGVLARGGYLRTIGEHNVFDSKGEGIARIFERLDKDICKRCDKRIFIECASVPYEAPGEIPVRND